MSDQPLFDGRERDDPSVAREEEPRLAFLDRVDDPVFDHVRRLLNTWFAEYPSAHREELRRRLASRDHTEFHAAWFELYLHAVHRRLGFNVTPHPDLEDVSTHPDFRLTRDGQAILLEATIIGDRDEASRKGRIARIVDAVNRTRSDDFRLRFDIEREGRDSPSMREVRRRIERWLASLSWEAVRGSQERGLDRDALPRRTERVGDWKFSFQAWPRTREARGRPGNAIWAGPSDGGVWEHGGDLRARLEEKAASYGKPREPVVIAVRMDRLGAGADDVQQALLGPTIGRALPRDPATVVATGRRGAGFFRSERGGARNRHVAGVLFFGVELRPSSVARETPVLWLHPDPQCALPSDLPWRRGDLSGDQPQITGGTFDPTRVFELPEADLFEDPHEWPGEPFKSLL